MTVLLGLKQVIQMSLVIPITPMRNSTTSIDERTVNSNEVQEVDHHIISNNVLIDSDHLEIKPIDAPDEIERRRNITLFPSPQNHPFAGARDMNGHWGYVADP